jgi:GTP-binding protein Era
MAHKAGFVNIIGYPNVGKSTLMNEFVGEKLSIITYKAQTTRHRILGIVNGEDFQIIYSDTPGILVPKYKLQQKMLNFALSALDDADIILYVTEIGEKIDSKLDFINKLNTIETPVIVLINKIDLSNQEKVEEWMAEWQKILPKADVIPISAKERFNLEKVINRIQELLPESEPYFGKDQLTDKSQRFFASEIIREKILLHYKQEIPYSVEIDVEAFKEKDNVLLINATIYVEKDSQKGIIIGHRGEAIKRIGIEARKDMEDFFGSKIFLELFVKVAEEWRSKERELIRFGYHI